MYVFYYLYVCYNLRICKCSPLQRSKVGGAVLNMPPKLASGRANAKGKAAVSAGVQNCRPAAVRIKEVVLV